MILGFDWDTSDMSILLQAKLSKPLYGTARIVINSLHIKGDVCDEALALLQVSMPTNICYFLHIVLLLISFFKLGLSALTDFKV